MKLASGCESGRVLFHTLHSGTSGKNMLFSERGQMYKMAELKEPQPNHPSTSKTFIFITLSNILMTKSNPMAKSKTNGRGKYILCTVVKGTPM